MKLKKKKEKRNLRMTYRTAGPVMTFSWELLPKTRRISWGGEHIRRSGLKGEDETNDKQKDSLSDPLSPSLSALSPLTHACSHSLSLFLKNKLTLKKKI